MSLDRSLKSASSLVRHRNVLKRDERMARLKDEEKWPADQSIFGLPKVANRKAAVGKAVKEEAVEGATPAAAGAAPAAKGGAAGAKGAAPAAKGAAPAAKGAAAPGAKGGAAAPAAKGKK